MSNRVSAVRDVCRVDPVILAAVHDMFFEVRTELKLVDRKSQRLAALSDESPRTCSSLEVVDWKSQKPSAIQRELSPQTYSIGAPAASDAPE